MKIGYSSIKIDAKYGKTWLKNRSKRNNYSSETLTGHKVIVFVNYMKLKVKCGKCKASSADRFKKLYVQDFGALKKVEWYLLYWKLTDAIVCLPGPFCKSMNQ